MKRSRSNHAGFARVVAHTRVNSVYATRRQAHRCPRVAGVGLLHRVDRQRADRIDAQLVQRCLIADLGQHVWAVGADRLTAMQDSCFGRRRVKSVTESGVGPSPEECSARLRPSRQPNRIW